MLILRSKKVGITKLLTICTNLESFENIKKIIDLDEIIFGTFGIHPHETDNYKKVDLKYILKVKKKYKKIIGIGETGSDFYYNHSDKKTQKDIYELRNRINNPKDLKDLRDEIDKFEKNITSFHASVVNNFTKQNIDLVGS